MIISIFKQANDTNPLTTDLPWQDLLSFLTEHDVRVNKDSFLWSPASYEDGSTRCKENVVAVSCATFDLDGKVTFDIDSVLERFADYDYAAHTTHNHTSEHPKWRGILPLASPIQACDWPEAWACLYEMVPENDPTTKDCSRMFYLPSCPPGVLPEVRTNAGCLFDLQAILDEKRKSKSLSKPATTESRQQARTHVSNGTPEMYANWAKTVPIEEGGRNRTAYHIVAEGLARGHDDEVVYQVLADYTARSGLDDDEPSGQRDRVWESATSAHAKRPFEPNLPEYLDKASKTDVPYVADGSSRPKIILRGSLREDAKAIIDGLMSTNEPPHIFQRGRELVRVVRGGTAKHDDGFLIEGLRVPAFRAHANERLALSREKKKKDGETIIEPTDLGKDQAEYIMQLERLPFPPLSSIIHAPTYAPNGQLITVEGYSRDGAVFLDLRGMCFRDIPKAPTLEDVAEARWSLEYDFLGEFPFAEESSLAHAVAMGIQPIVRLLIDGPTPIYMVSAPGPGSGKSLLAENLAFAVTGRMPEIITEASDDDEWRKRITSTLIKCPTVVIVDNVGRLESGSLAAVLTSRTWSDRLLGRTENVSLPNLSTWVATGNNPRLSGEIARRTVWIALDPKKENPWMRTGFAHDPLASWVRKNRVELVTAFLILVQHWISVGMPRSKKSIGSFEAWAGVIGGILEAAGIPGFLGNAALLYKRADTESEEWIAFVQLWWERHEGRPVKVEELYRLFSLDSPSMILGSGQERSQKVKLGKGLSERRDRVIGGFKVVKGDNDSHDKVSRYWLVPSS